VATPSQAGGFDAIMLAGGRAARLGGADKPGLVVAGATMAASVAAAATAAGARAVIVVGPARPGLATLSPPPPGGVSFVAEDPPGSGPVPALRRGMTETDRPAVVLLAADLPFLRAAQIRLLLSAAGLAGRPATGPPASGPGAGISGGGPAAGARGAVLVDDCGQPQWLVSCWRAAALREALGAYRDSSLRGLLQPLLPVLVGCRLRGGQAPPWFDCDTADELRLARGWPAAAVPGRHAADTTREARG
jgi:molybdopterin-guanine dinucleotide biosynthesis protein A